MCTQRQGIEQFIIVQPAKKPGGSTCRWRTVRNILWHFIEDRNVRNTQTQKFMRRADSSDSYWKVWSAVRMLYFSALQLCASNHLPLFLLRFFFFIFPFSLPHWSNIHVTCNIYFMYLIVYKKCQYMQKEKKIN